MSHRQHVRHYVALAREANHIALAYVRSRQWGMAANMIEVRDRYMTAAREWRRLAPALRCSDVFYI